MKSVDGKPIDECSVLVSGGRGIHEEDMPKLAELAELLGGEVACSRPLCDNGWLPHEKQIGQSGTTVKPGFILNLAVSGSVQYPDLRRLPLRRRGRLPQAPPCPYRRDKAPQGHRRLNKQQYYKGVFEK